MPKRMGLDVFPPRLACTLTPREYEIATLASAALSNREIARRLGVTEGTVKAHLHNIYQKVDVRAARLAPLDSRRNEGARSGQQPCRPHSNWRRSCTTPEHWTVQPR